MRKTNLHLLCRFCAEHRNLHRAVRVHSAWISHSLRLRSLRHAGWAALDGTECAAGTLRSARRSPWLWRFLRSESILDIAVGGFSFEYIFQDDRTGCKRIFKYVTGWLYTTFLVLLDMRATVPYWKTRLHGWTQLFAAGRDAALEFAW